MMKRTLASILVLLLVLQCIGLGVIAEPLETDECELLLIDEVPEATDEEPVQVTELPELTLRCGEGENGTVCLTARLGTELPVRFFWQCRAVELRRWGGLSDTEAESAWQDIACADPEPGTDDKGLPVRRAEYRAEAEADRLWRVLAIGVDPVTGDLTDTLLLASEPVYVAARSTATEEAPAEETAQEPIPVLHVQTEEPILELPARAEEAPNAESSAQPEPAEDEDAAQSDEPIPVLPVQTEEPIPALPAQAEEEPNTESSAQPEPAEDEGTAQAEAPIPELPVEGEPAESDSLEPTEEEVSSDPIAVEETGSEQTARRLRQVRPDMTTPELTIGVGQRYAGVRVIVEPETEEAVSWSSSDPSVVSVDPQTGALVGRAAGTATVTAAVGEAQCSYTVTVMTSGAAVKRVSLSVPSVLYVGQQVTPVIRLTPSLATGCVLTSSAPEKLAVDGGTIVALATGKVKLTATAPSGKSAVCTITIKAAPERLTIGTEQATLCCGDGLTLKAATDNGCPVEVSVSDPSVAFYDSKTGRVETIGEGSTDITVSTYNGLERSCRITVVEALSSFELSAERTVWGSGEQIVLQTDNVPACDTLTVTYTSSAPKVVTVQKDGTLLARKTGRATVTGKTYNGLTATVVLQVVTAPKSIVLSVPEKTMGVGETQRTTLVMNGGSGSVGYSSSAPDIVSVDGDGVVTALAEGSATITARSFNGKTSSVQLTVAPAPSVIYTERSALEVCLGDSAVIEAQTDTASALSFSCDRPEVLSIDADTGRLTALAEGTAICTVSTYNGLTAQVEVRVVAEPTALTISLPQSVYGIGETIVPTTHTEPEDSTAVSVTLSSGTPKTVALQADGTLKALRAGKARLIAKTYNGLTAEAEITVAAAPKRVSLTAPQGMLGVGQSLSLKVGFLSGQGGSYRLESSDPEVLSVAEGDTVVGMAPGSATVTVTTYNGRTASVTLEVKPAPESVTLKKTTLRIPVGFSYRLSPSVGDAMEGFTYTSADESVATVDAEGVIRAVAIGSTEVTVETWNGLSTTAEVIVAGEVTELRIEAERTMLGVGDLLPLTAIATGLEEDLDISCTWSTTTPKLISVDAFGTVKGLAIGTASVTATAENGVSATITLEVLAAPRWISVSLQDNYPDIGVTQPIEYVLSASTYAGVSFTSSDPEVARVEEDGTLTAVSFGKATITASTANGRVNSIVVYCGGYADELPLKGAYIGLDAGHQEQANSGKEPVAPWSRSRKAKVSHGASGKATHISEYRTNLQVAVNLRERLEALGAVVYMVRIDHNVNISNVERACLMNDYGVDLWLRLHCNSVSVSAKGLGGYVSKSAPNSEECQRLSACLTRHMAESTGLYEKPINISDKYSGNNWSEVPCVLLEMGYVSNHSEDRFLNSPEGQDLEAIGMLEGIREYLDR